jgi:hypothetical protein
MHISDVRKGFQKVDVPALLDPIQETNLFGRLVTFSRLLFLKAHTCMQINGSAIHIYPSLSSSTDIYSLIVFE